jgi:choice-of-anchor B domain-containing protein
VQIVELTQLLGMSGPTLEIAPTVLYDVVNLAHNIAINTESEYAYIIGNTLDVLDVSTPESPELVASYDEYGSHDIHSVIYHGPDGDYFGMEILFSLAYDALEILNADDKTDIQLISQVADSTNSTIHQGWTDESHRWLYYNDEADEINDSLNTRTFIVDIEDLDAPVIVGFYEHDTQSTDHNLYVSNGKVYASNNSSGLRVLSIEEDGGLELSGFFDTYPENDSSGYVGVWSNYPYFPSKNIALSDRGGLFVIRESSSTVEPLTLENSKFLLSPNPASTSVRLTGDFHNCSVVIYEMSGRRVISTSTIPSLNGLNLDISGLEEGVYLINMISSEGEIEGFSKLVIGAQ